MKSRMHVMRLFSVLVFLLSGFAGAVQADCKPQKSESVGIARVARDGALTLTDGRVLRLAALERPDGMAALAMWTDVIGKAGLARSTFYHGDKATDRYGQLQGLLVRDGLWIDAALVRQGAARVRPRADMRFCVPELLKLEAEARAARRGLWAEAANLPLQATNVAGLAAREGQFVLVEGVVTDAVKRGRRLYLNFGPDWRTDFTVTVAPSDVRLFTDPRLKTKSGGPAMKGEHVRVRGVLTRYNGPELILTVPEQLEFLGPQRGTVRE